MKRNEFENRKGDDLSKMHPEDWEEAMNRKEDVWHSLDINTDKKKSSFKGLLWFLLSFLLAFSGGFLINQMLKKDKKEPVVIANNAITIQLQNVEKTLKDERQMAMVKLQHKDQKIDSLENVVRGLNDRLLTYLNASNLNKGGQVEKIYLTDTVYRNEVVIQEVIKEKIVRDTVWLKAPFLNTDDELVAGNIDEFQKASNDAGTVSDEKNKKKRRKSIQFNFRDASSEK